MRELVWPEPELVAQLREGVEAKVAEIREQDEADRKRQEAANGRQ